MLILHDPKEQVNEHGWLWMPQPQSVKNFNWRKSYFMQQLVWWTRLRNIKIFMYLIVTKKPSSWRSLKAKFIVWGFEVAQEPRPLKNSIGQKKHYHVDSHVILSSTLEILHRGNLDHSVNHGWWRTHFISNHVDPLPYNSWSVHFFRRLSLNRP